MSALANPCNMIYNVYQRGMMMNVQVAKWGNSLGIRIPSNVVSALDIKAGDSVSYEVRDNELVLRKEVSTKQLFEAFYGKAVEELTEDDFGSGPEMDWGEDVGKENF